MSAAILDQKSVRERSENKGSIRDNILVNKIWNTGEMVSQPKVF